MWAKNDIKKEAFEPNSDPITWRKIGPILGQLVILLILSASSALSVYSFLPNDVKPTLPAGLMWVEASTASLDQSFWVDAREAEIYQKGHIPGAINVSMADWAGGLERFVKNWDRKKPVIVYCDEGCPASIEIAEKLKKVLPKANIGVLEGGYPAWEKLKK